MWEPVVETRDSSREESRKEAIGQNITEMTNWSFQTLSKPNRKKNTVEVLDSNNCFKCTKNKHFRKRILHLQKILLQNIRSRFVGWKKRRINKLPRGRAMSSSTARLTTGHSVWSSTSGHTDSASKIILSTTQASWSVRCTKRNQFTIERYRQVKFCWNNCL